MKKISLLFLSLIALSSYANQIVQGVVFEDANKNNQFDKSEKGIPGVAVSNGEEVVQTNEKGEYKLSVGNDQIIFVIKPSHYSFPVNELNQPQFFYIHKPLGSPQLKYAGTAATGKLPKAVNFPLIRKDQNTAFSIVVFGDPQPYTQQEVDFFHKGIVNDLKGTEGPVFGMSLGDLVGDNLNLHQPYSKAIADIGIPWFNVMGNHDMNYDVQSDSLADETFEKDFGPANFSFNEGNVHFVILDDILYPDPRDGEGYWGGFREDQFRFIENDLKLVPKDRLVVMAFHIPISEEEGGNPFNHEHRQRLFELLKDFPYTLTLSAHTHFQSQDFFAREDGWLQDKMHHHYNVGTTCGDWYSGRLDENGVPLSTMRDGTPKGYAFIHFDNNQYVIDYKVAGKPADYRMNLHVPKVVKKDVWEYKGIYVNFFMGSKYDTVYYRVDNGAWETMEYDKDYDPAYLPKYLEWDYTDELFKGRRPSNPVACNHLWSAFIPTRLEVGEHLVEVKVTDMFGRTFTEKKSFRIEEGPAL